MDGAVIMTILAVPGSEDAIVLLDPEWRPPVIEKWHPFPNIVRVGPSGQVRWRAELTPHETTAKSYYRVDWRSALLIG